MFFKLCKNELKSSYRSFLILYVVVMMSAILLDVNDDGLFSSLMAFTYAVVLIVLSIMCIVVVVRNYHISMFTKKAYLTHTLPVSSTQLLLSKLCCAVFWVFISIIIFFLSYSIIVIRIFNFNWDTLFNVISLTIQEESVLKVILYLFYLIIASLESISLLYFVMNVVHTKYVRKFRVVIALVLIILISSIIDFVFKEIWMLIFDAYSTNSIVSFYYNFDYDSVVFDIEMKQLFFSVCKSIIVNLLYFFGSKYILDQKMEIE